VREGAREGGRKEAMLKAYNTYYVLDGLFGSPHQGIDIRFSFFVLLMYYDVCLVPLSLGTGCQQHSNL
jgi:hypothetical protein